MYDSKGLKNETMVCFSDGAHIIYSYCPIGYIIINYSTVRTCLMLELMTKYYNGAALGCQTDGGDLIRIDSAEKYTIFQQFIASKLSYIFYLWTFTISKKIWVFLQNHIFQQCIAGLLHDIIQVLRIRLGQTVSFQIKNIFTRFDIWSNFLIHRLTCYKQ